MKKYLILIVLAALTLVGCSHRNAGRLVILHVNDTHSHFDPLRDGRGGILERCAFIDSVRKAEGAGNVLLVHAGDFNQGTSYYTLLGGQLEVDAINAMGYDVVTLGNHEFDNGIEDLDARIQQIKCPVVCANYDFSPFPMGKKITPYTILERGGHKIGVIGLLCDIKVVVSRATADRIPCLGNNVQIANKWAAYLKEKEGCDLVFLLTHIGFSEDCALVPSLHNVDFIIGGHSHTFIDEPKVVNDADGRPVPVVQNGCWGEDVGMFTVLK